MKKKYNFRESNPIYKNRNAQIVGEFLERSFPDQKIDTAKLVELAKNPKCEIHKYFDWDDKEAAHKYRIIQARQMINALYVESESGNRIRAYENVYLEETGKREYIDIDRISEVEDLFEQVVQSAFRELKYWKLKYQQYKEHFSDVFEVIDKLDVKGVTNAKKESRSRKKSTNPLNRNKNSENHPRR